LTNRGRGQSKLFAGKASGLEKVLVKKEFFYIITNLEFWAIFGYSCPRMANHKEYTISTKEQEEILKKFESRTDIEATRIRKYLSMPDLSRTPGSPVHEIVKRTLEVKSLDGLDIIKIPEIISIDILFDLFNMPEGHPARSKSDTYYVDEKNVLRTHDTVFWYYYLNLPEVKERIARKESVGAICFGKVYRKDEIDSRHMNVFHQIGGLYLTPDEKKTVTPDDLKSVLTDVAKSVFGEDVNFRFYDHTFPYTDPSFEMEAFINDKWIEMLGSGLPRKTVLKNFGLEGYNGWAFGFGMERLAIASMDLPDIRLLWSEDPRVTKQLKLGQKFVEVSKYPPVIRDISFVVKNDFIPNDYFDLVRETIPDMVEEIALIDKYENAAKFGEGNISYAYRVTYRSLDKTLTSEEVDTLHKKLEDVTVKTYEAKIR
jgi:phenylalanyl-tRNA synthetase alpha chain